MVNVHFDDALKVLGSTNGIDVYVQLPEAKIPLPLGTASGTGTYFNDAWGWPAYQYFFMCDGTYFQPEKVEINLAQYDWLQKAVRNVIGMGDLDEGVFDMAFKTGLEQIGPMSLQSRFYAVTDIADSAVYFSDLNVAGVDKLYYNDAEVVGTFDPVTCKFTADESAFCVYMYNDGNWMLNSTGLSQSSSGIYESLSGNMYHRGRRLEVYGQSARSASPDAIADYISSYYIEYLLANQTGGMGIESVRIGSVAFKFNTEKVLELVSQRRKGFGHSGNKLMGGIDY